jgi:membrane fusion protein (multidrug efflux system)
MIHHVRFRKPRLKKKPTLIGVGVLVLLVACYVGYRYLFFQSTNNAYVEAHTSLLSARIPGTVERVFVDENFSVKKGDVLILLDDRDYRAAADQAEADLEQARADAENAATKYRRYEKLWKSRSIPEQQYDDQSAEYRSRTKRVASLEAALETAKLRLSYTRIVAPSDGVVGKRSVERGMVITAGQALFGFVEGHLRWVTANFRETELDGVVPGKKAKVKVDSISGRTFTGEVESIAPHTGATFALLPPDNATGNFTKVVQRVPVRIKLAGLSQEDISLLQSGLSAEVSVRK